MFRDDTGALCGLGKVMDDSGTLTVVCYAPKGVTLNFKVWLAESGVEEAVVVKCDNASKLVAPESGDFYEGHAISGRTVNEYTVRFNANGGEGTMADQAFLYDEEQALRANAFTRVGYTFAGWNVSAPRSEDAASPLFEAWRNGWKTEQQKPLAATLKGQEVTIGENGNIVLTVGTSGAVTAKGTFGSYSASCSTVLIPAESKGTYVVYLYFPPKAGQFEGWASSVVISISEE